ncbi:MAG: tRNA adenosine(34) deaminase TadA [Thermodesulfobacteriota bacterium]
MDLHYFMQYALKEAKKGWLNGEVPIGAVMITPSDEIVAKDHNRCISLNDPTAHAEILVIRQAAKKQKNYRLNGMTMVVTIEPCPMCMGAIMHARLDALVFGAFDPKFGAAGSIYNMPEDEKLNHKIKVISCIMEKECRSFMQNFFKTRRHS